MKMAVVCANGKEGKLVVKEALSRGLDVTAVVREQNQSDAKQAIVKDLFALTRDDLKGFDVVVEAVEHLCDLLAGTQTRLLVVGGAGSLYVNPQHTACVADGPDFPDAFKPLAAAHDQALNLLRTRRDVNWTYISPAADFQAEGVRTGAYRLGGEELILNSRGESVISYADYAIALVDEAVSGQHAGQRISVVSC